jgi:outer membrane protein assembly factor BamB
VLADNKGPRLDRLFGASFLAALDRRTGEVVWRVKREPGDSFGTPVVATIAGRPQVVAAGKKWITSYDPATGDELWRCGWSADRTANTVGFDESRVFASSTIDDRQLIAVRADGTGDVTATHVAWKETQQIPDVPSPLVMGGRLYTVADNGVLCCREAATGKTLWKGRMGGDVAASPVAAGDEIFVATDKGTVIAFRPGDKYEEVGRWDAGEPVLASPAVANGCVYLRTESAVYCLGGAEAIAAAPNAGEVKK